MLQKLLFLGLTRKINTNLIAAERHKFNMMKKYGAPATSHVRLITAEDVETLQEASKELSKTEQDLTKEGNETTANEQVIEEADGSTDQCCSDDA